MISFSLSLPARRPPSFLCLGAHSDDLEIGCAGTLLELALRYPRARVYWAVMSGAGERGAEARRSARALLKGFGQAEISVGEFRDGYFPHSYAEIKDSFEKLKRNVRPDLIFTHALEDRHQDHRLVSELTWNTWRDTVILEYEIPKYEGELNPPNVFVPIRSLLARRKVRHLMRHFASQRSRRWFTAATFEGQLRLRGIECNSESGLAEAFCARKICL